MQASSAEPLPPAWQEAFARDQIAGKASLADPLPERCVARLLAAFIGAGLIFLVLPGTLLGVWNLVNISSQRQSDAISAAWIQAHGHAQLFGWVATFMIGISLYAIPKFRGGYIRSLAAGWTMFALWTAAVALRWFSGVFAWRWHEIWPASAAVELIVSVLLLWQATARGPSRRSHELWEILTFAGLGGLAATLVLQLTVVSRAPAAPAIPAEPDQLFLTTALWIFCFPVVWGFSARLLPAFLGLKRSASGSGYTGLALLGAGALLFAAGRGKWAAAATLSAVAAACWSLRIFHPGERAPKVIGVDPLYPSFVRGAWIWLVLSSLLVFGAPSPGWLGASRHAFTVGFLAGMIFAIGPRILPAFLNSRELWSVSLMRWSLVLLTTGCALRVASEPLAYSGIVPWAWSVLPVSASIELSAVVLFALNLGKTLATPVPSWFGREQVKGTMMLYWYVSSYPATKKLLIDAGLATLARIASVPKTLTLADAAAADGASLETVLSRLGDFFDSRRTRTARANS
ncbi:MAG TPA: NnrS family protein [Bryobacteraceae bacterium]|nr:NnrS family protein [Bryobacteraceae bacterium]